MWRGRFQLDPTRPYTVVWAVCYAALVADTVTVQLCGQSPAHRPPLGSDLWAGAFQEFFQFGAQLTAVFCCGALPQTAYCHSPLKSQLLLVLKASSPWGAGGAEGAAEEVQ